MPKAKPKGGGGAKAKPPMAGPKIFIYCPYPGGVDDDTITSGARTMVAIIGAKGKRVHPEMLVHSGKRGDQPLKITGPGDTVYITAHGNGATIGSGPGADENVSLTPLELTQRLLEDGLNYGVTRIRVSACNSGRQVFQGGVDYTYAKRLCQRLHQRGVARVIVSGYPGAVETTRQFLHVTADGHGRNIRRDFFGVEGTEIFQGVWEDDERELEYASRLFA